jgi:uncharacterized protein
VYNTTRLVTSLTKGKNIQYNKKAVSCIVRVSFVDALSTRKLAGQETEDVFELNVKSLRFLAWELDRGKGLSGMLSEEEKNPVHLSTSDTNHQMSATVREKYGDDYYQRIGKKGGITLKQRRGSEYYRSIAQKGGQANVSKYGSNHFSEMGKKGGNATKENQDADFYSRIGKLGGAAKRQKKMT